MISAIKNYAASDKKDLNWFSSHVEMLNVGGGLGNIIRCCYESEGNEFAVQIGSKPNAVAYQCCSKQRMG